jgi:hypothetical protein
MNLDPFDEQAAALLAELDRIIGNHYCPFSARIRTLKGSDPRARQLDQAR